MLRNQNGTVRSIIPDKVIFFTDGMPNRSRLTSYTGNAASVVADPRDAGLKPRRTTTFYQIGLEPHLAPDRGHRRHRRRRRVRRRRPQRHGAVGVRPAPGYVWQYERGNGVEYQRGYSATYERGNGVTPERGYHVEKQRGNNVVWERGYNTTYQVASGMTFQRRTDSKLVFER